MKDLAILLASALTTENIIDSLQRDIDKWKEDQSEKSLNMIEMNCMLLLSKKTVTAAGGGIDGAKQVISDLDKMERASNLLMPDQN